MIHQINTRSNGLGDTSKKKEKKQQKIPGIPTFHLNVANTNLFSSPLLFFSFHFGDIAHIKTSRINPRKGVYFPRFFFMYFFFFVRRAIEGREDLRSLPYEHRVHLMSAMIVNTITWAMAHDVTDSGTDASRSIPFPFSKPTLVAVTSTSGCAGSAHCRHALPGKTLRTGVQVNCLQWCLFSDNGFSPTDYTSRTSNFIYKMKYRALKNLVFFNVKYHYCS